MLPVKAFVDFITQNQLFTGDSKLLAAISGGMDSVLMAHLLKAGNYNFDIAHCNFQLRGDEALDDQEFCRNLAKQLGVNFFTVNFDTLTYAGFNKLSIQMAARQLRYQWFEQLRQEHGFDAVTLAHHQNDTVETILLNLTRGTGIAGMHGILPKTGTLARPMLFMDRDEVVKAVMQNNLAYVEDSSNASVKYARNKIRHEVIPILKELNPNLEKTFDRNLRHFRELEQLLQQRLDKVRNDLFVYEDTDIHLSISKLKNLNPAHLFLYGLLQHYGFNEATIDDLLASLDKHSGRVFEGQGYRIILDRDRLILTPMEIETPGQVNIQPNQLEVFYSNYRLTVLHTPLIIRGNPMAVSVDAEKLIYPLTLRGWQQGDFFYPLGMQGSKKVSDFFINQKIPVFTKNKIPLLVNGDGDIIWVCGYRLDERYKVNENTKKVIIFELYNHER
jgi:tRNA(Ile)-lysidine synthase